MIDQETFVLTAIILGVGYMLVRGVESNPVSLLDEEHSAVLGMKSRGEHILETASKLHSRAGNLANVSEKRQGILRDFLRFQREASQVAVRYPEIQQIVDRMEDVKKTLVPQTYKDEMEILSPIPEEPPERPSSVAVQGGSRSASPFIQLGEGRARMDELSESEYIARGRRTPLSRLAEDVAFRPISASERVRMGERESPVSVGSSVDAWRKENRHNTEEGMVAANDGGAFVQMERSQTPLVKIAEERAQENAGLSDATSLIVNNHDSVKAQVNAETPIPRPVPRTQNHETTLVFENEDSKPAVPSRVIPQPVIKSHEPDLSQSAMEHNQLDDLQPPSQSPFLQLGTPLADNESSSPNLKREAEDVEEMEEQTKLLETGDAEPSQHLYKFTNEGAVYEEFMSEGRKQDITDEFRDEVLASIASIQKILEGRSRENSGAKFEESINRILNILPANDKVQQQVKAWRQSYEGQRAVVHDVRGKKVTTVGTGKIEGIRLRHAESERNEQEELSRREREHSINKARSVARANALASHRQASAAKPISFAALGETDSTLHTQVNNAWRAIVDTYKGSGGKNLWKNKQPVRVKTFWAWVRSQMYPLEGSGQDVGSAINFAINRMHHEEAKKMGHVMGGPEEIKAMEAVLQDDGYRAVKARWNEWLSTQKPMIKDSPKNLWVPVVME